MFDTVAPFGFMPRRYRLLLWFGGFGLLGLIEAVRLWGAYNYGSSTDVPLTQVLAWSLADYYLWGLLAMLIFRLPQLVPVRRETVWSAIPLHVVIAVVTIVAHIVLYTVIFGPLSQLTDNKVGASHDTFGDLLENMLWVRGARSFLIYGAFLAVGFMVAYYRRVNEQQRRLSETQTALARAQTEALKMQIHPHFLFNTLNSIATLVHTDPHTADRMITQLSGLLRKTLAAADVPTVPLFQEIQYLKAYLDIQQMRFKDRLQVNWDIDDTTSGLHVPFLILQPIVENAVRHGIGRRSEGGIIEIAAVRHNDRLTLTVRDNGPGLSDSDTEGGIGLTNTRHRLQHLYDSRASLTLKSLKPTGLEVRMDIPVEGNETTKKS